MSKYEGFRAGTGILTFKGKVNIEDIEVGTDLICYDDEGYRVSGTVIETQTIDISGLTDVLMKIEYEQGTLYIAKNHLVLKDDGTFDEICNFNVGDDLIIANKNKTEILSIEPYTEEEEYLYNLTISPHSTFISELIRVHNMGGGGGSKGHTPEEFPNTLQSVAMVSVIDLISEGEIEGFVHEDGGEGRDIYFNDVPISSNGVEKNFTDIRTRGMSGRSDQDYIFSPDGMTSIGTPYEINVAITKSGGPIVSQSIPAHTDFVSVLLYTPSFFKSEDNGDLVPTKVELSVSVSDNGGSPQYEGQIIFEGKCSSEYQRTCRIQLENKHGDGPYTIYIERLTNDSDSIKVVDTIYWGSYTAYEIEKFNFPYSAIMGMSIRADQFSGVPERRYHVKGIKCRVPNNYNQTTRVYTGVWDGTFKTARVYTNNPAWLLLEILTNSRYGYDFDDSEIDLASLYSCAVYSDTFIDDGFGSTEPRFTLNTQIAASAEGYHLLNLLCSTMRASFYSSGTQIIFTQDRPADPIINVSNASVVDGVFNYSSTSGSVRHNQVSIQWNDPENNYKSTREYYDDSEDIRKSGRINSMDTVAFGCTSRGQARRHAKWILDTELYQNETVTFTAGLDHAFVVPGDIISVTDENFAISRAGGRIKSFPADSTAQIDAPFTFEAGQTYQLRITAVDMSIQIYTITNSPGTTDMVTVSQTITNSPLVGSNWQIVASNLNPRQFRVISRKETNGGTQYEITALFHDPNKYARVEQGLYFDQPIYTAIPDANEVLPPSNLDAQMYQSNIGTARQFNILLSWTHSSDPRRKEYDVQISYNGGAFEIPPLKTNANSYTFENVKTGDYDFRVRTVTLVGVSKWVTYSTQEGGVFSSVSGTTKAEVDVTGLQIIGGGTEWTGRDCEFEWDEITIDDDPNFKNYKLEIRKADDTHLRYVDVETNRFTYTYSMNMEDTNGTPVRSIKVFAWMRDVYNSLSETPASATFTNPAPDMSSTTPDITEKPTYIKVEWTPNSDPDMSHYKIYSDTSNPPTTELGTVVHPDNQFEIHGLTFGETYYVQIEPWDEFGVGVKSVIDSGSPTLIPSEDLDIELSTSIEISDSDSNTPTTLQKLYDFNTDTDGITYSAGGWSWIQYDVGIEYFIDSIFLWTDSAINCYMAYSTDGTTWSYLKANGSHALVESLNQYRLLTASNSSDAQTNYWTTNSSGLSYAFFPQRIICRYVRLYFDTSSAHTIYELKFNREVVAEQIYAQNLSSITADIGTVTAGSIQSADYSSTNGMVIDLDDGDFSIKKDGTTKLSYDSATGNLSINGSITISGGSGYSNLSDKPTSLANINSTEGSKLSGIENGADVTANNTSAGITNQGDLAVLDFVDWATKVTGTGKPDNYADVTANNTAYDTARVDGITANTVRTNAAKGVTFTSVEAGVIAYLDQLTSANQIGNGIIGSNKFDTTVISGGKIVTNLLSASNILAGTLYTQYVNVLSSDGKTKMTSTAIEVWDAANVLRVRIGRIS